jgi:hypothetical protein
MAFAEFLDRCCQRYVKQPSYRRTLENERPDHRPVKRKAA